MKRSLGVLIIAFLLSNTILILCSVKKEMNIDIKNKISFVKTKPNKEINTTEKTKEILSIKNRNIPNTPNKLNTPSFFDEEGKKIT
jgi:hypothetical protein